MEFSVQMLCILVNAAYNNTYYVHECENVILDMLLAVETDHRVINSQQHLDVVVIFLRMPPLALRLRKFMFNKIQSFGEVCNPNVCHCKIWQGWAVNESQWTDGVKVT